SNETVEALEYKVVHEITDDMLLDESALIVEMLDENYHTASIEGFSIVNKDGMYFIPTEVALNDQTFKQWIEDEAKKKVVFDAKAVYVALLNQGMTLKGVVFDLLLGAYLAKIGRASCRERVYVTDRDISVYA